MEKLRASFIRYQPLLVVLAVALLVALLLPGRVMGSFMGMFFILLAMFKLFDLRGFANGFQKYDLIAKPFRPYAYAYPFMELGLGVAYLAQVASPMVYGATMVLMTISAAGVIREVARGNKFNCACLGTTLNVPLSTVSILENAGMGAMALFMLLAA